MKSRPILFSGAMVRAILAGTKTQTRRIISPQPTSNGKGTRGAEHIGGTMFRIWSEPLGRSTDVHCPYGKPGDLLWVRENWKMASNWDDLAPRDMPILAMGHQDVRYLADGDTDLSGKTRVSIHMPRWASRITLEITEIRAERLQDISGDDAIEEGIEIPRCGCEVCAMNAPRMCPADEGSAIEAYRALWDTINAERGFSWESNPWVWVIAYKEIK